MKNLIKGAFFVALLAIVVSSCGKYPEGPGLSLRSKKNRVAGEWEVEEYVDADGTTTQPSGDLTLTFDKDGTLTYSDGQASVSGTWEFNGDKTALITTIDFGFGETTTEQDILRLTNKEMWLEDEDDEDYTKFKTVE